MKVRPEKTVSLSQKTLWNDKLLENKEPYKVNGYKNCL